MAATAATRCDVRRHRQRREPGAGPRHRLRRADAGAAPAARLIGRHGWRRHWYGRRRFGWRRHRRTFWRLDDHALAVRRGHLWHSESHVPVSRVQHLDLRRGPLQRAAGLATLVVHTAGTRMNTVAIDGLAAIADAELRDRLARQLDHDDAL